VRRKYVDWNHLAHDAAHKSGALVNFYLWVLHPVAHLSNWFFMMPLIATKFQYVNSLLFSFSLTTCFGPYGPSSGEIYNYIFLMDYFYYNGSVARMKFDAEMLYVVHRYFDFVFLIHVIS
jgi:hypothetical protein